MCFRRKNKFEKLTREDVVESICALEKESERVENTLLDNSNKMKELKMKGKSETSHDLRLFYAKKINALKSEQSMLTQRAMYLMYNIGLLNKLKQAIDNNEFFNQANSISLNSLLKDQKGLTEFLLKTLKTRKDAEQSLTESDETFKQIEALYDKNEQIYGKSAEDDELLAVLEEEDSIESLVEGEITDTTAVKPDGKGV